jgi:S-phase kinase-associated protein 1
MEIARLMKDKKEEDIRDLFKLTHPDAKPKGPSKKITLQSGDGKDFLVDVEAAKMSVTIRTMLDDLGIESSSVDDEIKDILPIPNCNAAVLEKVILWCEHHKDDVEPEKKEPESKAVSVASKDPYELEGFDFEYIKAVNHVSTIGQSLIFDLIIAANYLNIPGLNDLCITEVANMLRGKSQEEIRYVFNLKNDKLIGEDDTYE